MISSCLPAHELSLLALSSYRACNNNGLDIRYVCLILAYLTVYLFCLQKYQPKLNDRHRVTSPLSSDIYVKRLTLLL